MVASEPEITHRSLHPTHIHFSGICGTAMASLAVLLQKRGHCITGSDANVYPPMSIFLAEHGLSVNEGYAAANLDPPPDLVVIGNTLSRGNPEVEATLSQGLRYASVSELLKEHFLQGNTSLVIAGTHGKTTATALLAWVFREAGRDPGFLIGGIAENLGTSCHEGQGGVFITEGDEYDTAFFDKRSKFFHYQPRQLLLNNLEFDHADIFDSLDDLKRAFRLLLRLVPANGIIAANGDDPDLAEVLQTAYSPITRFGLESANDLQGIDLRMDGNGMRFTVHSPNSTTPEREFHLPMLGEHNVRNALGVITLARHNGIADDTMQSAFDSFRGIKRRQELCGTVRGISVYDDFAHHTTAVRETLAALRLGHPEQRLIAVFEPRSNTSVRNLHESELIEALAVADHAVLSRPHRMEQIPEEQRLDPEAVAARLRQRGVLASAHPDSESILVHLVSECRPQDVVVIMSNGKFENLHQRLLDALADPAALQQSPTNEA
ncbi:MAG TPA: UDP-N-acetylmuramate:L-alanyl-gamma-D-glutamyl-meso-diaminopimelate ligase [Deltaproteobacteria bacterium]|nr:UDP-N-acetylmuramate:L-alanyl-gamma-D-glutamyl-meso-diaminopimelate ligase [Deltaproteobacteria bacterium]